MYNTSVVLPEFSAERVTLEVIDRLERRRADIAADRALVDKEVGEALAIVEKNYREAELPSVYFDSLSKEIRAFLPSAWQAIARPFTDRESREFGLWRGGDPVARLVYVFIGLVVGGLCVPPGSTNFFAPFIRDFYTFDTKMQNLEMVATSRRGDRSDRDDLQFKTTDGNDISMDVTVAWTIDPKKAPDILGSVGISTGDVKEKLVRPMARTLVRDVLNELDSESIYNSDKRFEKAEKAKKVLSEALEPYGVLISQVILHEHRFNPEYEKVIHDRKLAEQHAQQLRSEAEAAAQEALRNLESARGKVAADIAAAEGALQQAKLAADAELYQQQQNADAIVSERSAKAKAIQKRNEALRGSGGRAMVKLRVAEALQGKQIVLVPGGQSGVGIHKLDVNKLIDNAAAVEASGDDNKK